MITVTQNSTNKIVLDITTSVVNPYFLIKFTNPYDCTTFTALFQNRVSSSYYLIWIAESSTPDYVNGDVALIAGTYDLSIYAQTSSTNLNVNLANEFITEETLIVISEEDC